MHIIVKAVIKQTVLPEENNKKRSLLSDSDLTIKTAFYLVIHRQYLFQVNI